MDEHIMFVGLDVHKATIAVAIAQGGRREAARFVGEIDNTPAAVAKLVRSTPAKGRSSVSVTRPARAATVCIVSSWRSGMSALLSRLR